MRNLWHKYIVLFNNIRLEVGGMEGMFLPEERRRAKCEDTEMKNPQKHPSVHLIFEDLFDEQDEKTLKAFSGHWCFATGLTLSPRDCAITPKCGGCRFFFDQNQTQ